MRGQPFVRCSYTNDGNALCRVCTVAKGLGVVEIGHDKKGFSRARNRGRATGRGGGSGARGTGNGHGTLSYFDIVTVSNRILFDRFHALPFHVRNQRPNGIRDDHRRRYQAAPGAVRYRTNSHAGQRVRVVANGAIPYRTNVRSFMIRVVPWTRSNANSDIITRTASRTTSV